MNTQTKGVIGISHAIADLTDKGYNVSIPISEHSHFDLIASKENIHKAIQVKYRGLRKNGTIEVQFKSVWSNSKEVHQNPIDKTIIDIVCIYCPDSKECYYLDPKDFARSITLRIKKSRNPRGHQPSTSNLSADFLTPNF